MYNIGAIYEIIGRVVNGTCVTAYLVKDRRNNQNQVIPKNIVEQLALNKQIYNCTAQVYNRIVNLKGVNCKLSKLPKYNEQGILIQEQKNVIPNKKQADLQLVGKVQKGRTVEAYIICALTDTSKQVKVSRDQVLQLAQSGRLVNAKSQMNGDTIVLRGNNGFNLSQLKVYSG